MCTDSATRGGGQERGERPPCTTPAPHPPSVPLLRAASACCFSVLLRTPGHPDPDGSTLLAIADALLQQKAKRDAGSDPRFRYWPDDYGVFLDWCSVHQRDARGARTRIGEEEVAFRDALGNLDLFYAHAWPTTLMLTSLPAARPYCERGWPTFEYAASCLVKSAHGSVWPPAIDAGDPEGRSPLDRAPVDPARFAESMRQRTFTNGAAELEVSSNCTRPPSRSPSAASQGSTSAAAGGRRRRGGGLRAPAAARPPRPLAPDVVRMNAVPGLRGRGAGALLRALEAGALPQLWGLSLGGGSLDKDGATAVLLALARAKGALGALVFLQLGGEKFGDSELMQLARSAETDALPPLEALVLSGSAFGSRGLRALGAALARGKLPRLDELCMDACARLDDDALEALLRPLAEGAAPELRHLDVSGSAVGGEGLRALARKLEQGALPALKELDARDLQGQGVEQGAEALRAARAGLCVTLR
ncbi:unnamed protein product [Prorocentrum cordatum]|uniref:Uncharacterized protein n=1 Tax=Prorocentrum cordatum TaxID=2364126 RepID=A0ABN9PE12_9DINO|nr:unnamed protein product [Polarella glacialis]